LVSAIESLVRRVGVYVAISPAFVAGIAIVKRKGENSPDEPGHDGFKASFAQSVYS